MNESNKKGIFSFRWRGQNNQSASLVNVHTEWQQSESSGPPLHKTESVDDLDQKRFGFVNYENTCYMNSMLTVLYSCKPFRAFVLRFPSEHFPKSIENSQVSTTAAESKNNTTKYAKAEENSPRVLIEIKESHAAEYGMKESLFTCLKDIFTAISSSPEQFGVCNPQRFLMMLKRDNEAFRGFQHQDAHEFLNYLLNSIIECIPQYEQDDPEKQLVNKLFMGLLSSETKCLNCENITSRVEPFLDLSIDLENNTSVIASLKSFGHSEFLRRRDKFHCDSCHGLNEAEKSVKIKKLPQILALHLKRFQHTIDGHFTKSFNSVVFPSQLKISNYLNSLQDLNPLFDLFAIVIHMGAEAYHGHYVSIIKSESNGWLLYDDETVTSVSSDYIRNFFVNENGDATAYVLFYQSLSE